MPRESRINKEMKKRRGEPTRVELCVFSFSQSKKTE
jgi:hypothetical protein